MTKKVKFADIEIGQVYVTCGGTVVVNESGKTVGWGYDRVQVVEKNDTKLVVKTPWGTSCILAKAYPLFSTKEVEPRVEFKLVTTYISKQEIPFNIAVARGICAENSDADLPIEKFLIDLVQYFDEPRSISAAAKKFNISYHKVRYYLLNKIANIGKYKINYKKNSKYKLIYITEVNNGKSP